MSLAYTGVSVLSRSHHVCAVVHVYRPQTVKSYNAVKLIKDGAGIVLWGRVGGMTAILTGRSSKIVENRAKELHISIVRQGCTNKRAAYEELKEELQVTDDEVAYIGDDIIDLPVMRQVGLPIAVGDAAPEVHEIASFTTNHAGGHGAIREAVERILRAQGRFEEAAAQYLS